MLAMLVNSGTADDAVYNLPEGVDDVFLEDDGIRGNGISQIRTSNGIFETTPFAHPSGSLTINSQDGNSISIILPDSLSMADLTVNTTGHIYVGLVLSRGAVDLIATGSIAKSPVFASGIVASELGLVAGTGIGTSGEIHLTVGALEAETDTGGIFLRCGSDFTFTTKQVVIGGVDDTLAGLRVHTSGSIALTSTISILLADTSAEQIVQSGSESGDVSLRTTNFLDDITATVNNRAIVSPAGSILVQSGGRLSLGAGGECFANDVLAHKDIELISGEDMTICGSTNVVSDYFTHSTGGSIRSISNGSVFLGDRSHNTIVSAAGGGQLTVQAGFDAEVSLLGAAILFSAGAEITIRTSQLSIDSEAVISSPAKVTINANVGAGGVFLGPAISPGFAIELRDAEIDRIACPQIEITAPFIHITELFSPEHAATLSLNGHITVATPSDGLIVDNLQMSGPNIDLGSSQTTDIKNLAGRGNGGSSYKFHIRDNGGDLSIGMVADVKGLIATGNDVSITTTDGSITVAEPILNNGPITLDAQRNGSGIINQSGIQLVSNLFGGRRIINLTADHFDLQAGSMIHASLDNIKGQVNFASSSAGVAAYLGSDAAGTALSQAELNRINADMLRITADGDIIISDDIDLSHVGAVTLQAKAGGIKETTADEGTALTAFSLELHGAKGIGELDDLDISAYLLAFYNADGAVQIDNALSFTLGPVDRLTASANFGSKTIITGAETMNVHMDVKSQGSAYYSARRLDFGGSFNVPIHVEVVSGDLVANAGALHIFETAELVASDTVDMVVRGNSSNFGTAEIRGSISGENVRLTSEINGSDMQIYLTAALPNGIVVVGNTDNDYLNVSDVGSFDLRRYDISGDGVLVDTSVSIATSGIEGLMVRAGESQDIFNVVPSAVTRMHIRGGGPVQSFGNGDMLNLDLSGAVNALLPKLDYIQGQGVYSFDNRMDVEFYSIEVLLPKGPDLQVTARHKSVVAPGDVLIYEIEYSIVGQLGATNIRLYVQDFRGAMFNAQMSSPGWVKHTDTLPAYYTLNIGDLLAGERSTAMFAVTVDQPPGQSEFVLSVLIIANSDNGHDPVAENNSFRETTRIIDSGLYAVAADAGGGPHVRVFSADGSERFSFFAYAPEFSGGVRVAMGDVTGDGTPDIITAAGPGGGPHVRVFDGLSGQQVPGAIGSFFAYNAEFTGGAFLASADFNDDGHADIITGSDRGGRPHVRVFSGADGSVLQDFFEHPKMDGGVRVAAGDINGDGTPDVITAPGGGTFEAEVHVFDGKTGQPIAGDAAQLVAYPGFYGGVYVSSGDVNGDGRDDIVTGAGAGGGPHVKAFSGFDGSVLMSFFAYDGGFHGGVRVGTSDVGNDGRIDILTAAGPGGGPHVRAFGMDVLAEVASFFAFSSSFGGGVFVAGSVGTPDSVFPVDFDLDQASSLSFEQNAAVWNPSPGAATTEPLLPDSTALLLEAEHVDSLLTSETESDWHLPDDLLFDDRDAIPAASDETFWEDLAAVGSML